MHSLLHNFHLIGKRPVPIPNQTAGAQYHRSREHQHQMSQQQVFHPEPHEQRPQPQGHEEKQIEGHSVFRSQLYNPQSSDKTDSARKPEPVEINAYNTDKRQQLVGKTPFPIYTSDFPNLCGTAAYSVPAPSGNCLVAQPLQRQQIYVPHSQQSAIASDVSATSTSHLQNDSPKNVRQLFLLRHKICC